MPVERDPHRAEAEGKHLGDAAMVEEHEAHASLCGRSALAGRRPGGGGVT
jgi:hypothetical protein